MEILDKLRAKWASWFNRADQANKSRWFLLDRELTDPRDDEFAHASVVEALEQYIEDNPEPPYAIAIYGKWGQGKSSVARLLLNQLAEAGHEVVPEPISLWYYSADELPRVLNARLTKGKKRDEKAAAPNTKTTFAETHATPLSEQLVQDMRLVPSVVFTLGLSVISIIALYFLGTTVGHFISPTKVALPSRDGVVMALTKWTWGPVVAALVSYAFSRLKSLDVSKTLEPLTKPSELADDFQGLTNNERPVVLLDDLDRLSAAKMVRALEAIKAYLSHRSAIFIIPCDDGVLRNALETIKILDEPDGERFLEKFFQYSIRLPHYRRRDMRDYARTMMQKIHHPLTVDQSEHFAPEGIDPLLEILIHTGVETPRQVKKVLNEFSTGYLLCLERERSGVLRPAGLTRQSLPVVAKLAVLRADFPGFYASLTTDQTLVQSMNKVLADGLIGMEDHEVRTVYEFFVGTDYEEAIASRMKYVVTTSDDIKRRNKDLVRFLSMTRHVSDEAVKPFLFFKTDETRGHLQSARDEDLERDILSGNVRPVRTAINNSQDGGKSAIDLLAEVLIEAPPGLRLTRSAQVAVGIVDQIADQHGLLRQVANAVTSRYHEMTGTLTTTEPEKLFLLMSGAEDTLTRAKILGDHFRWAADASRSGSEVRPWSLAVMKAPELIVATNTTAQARPLVQLLGLTDVVEAVAQIPVGSSLVTVIGGQFFEDLCQAIADGANQETSPERVVFSFTPYVFEAFPPALVQGLAILVTSLKPEARAIGRELFAGGTVDLPRSARRQIVESIVGAALKWPNDGIVDEWLGMIEGELEADSGLLDDLEAEDHLAEVLAQGYVKAAPASVAVAHKHVKVLDSYLGAEQSEVHRTKLVEALGAVTEPGELLSGLILAMTDQLDRMSKDLLGRIVSAVDQHARHLSDAKRLRVMTEIMDALSDAGVDILAPKLETWIGNLSTDSLPWDTRRTLGMAIVRASTNTRRETMDSICTALTQMLQNGNQNQIRVAVAALAEFGPELGQMRTRYAATVFQRMQNGGFSDHESRSYALTALGYALPQNAGYVEQWNTWSTEILRQSPPMAVRIFEAGAAYLKSSTVAEFMAVCRPDNLWKRAIRVWTSRAIGVLNAQARIEDLAEAMAKLGSMEELIKAWVSTMSKDDLATLASDSLGKAAEQSSPSRVAWIEMAAQLRKAAGMGALEGQSEVIGRLLALPPGEVVDILEVLPDAYPEVSKEDRASVEQSILRFVERSKTSRELRAMLACVRKLFLRLPTKIKSQIITSAQAIYRTSTVNERSAVAEILGELDVPKGKFDVRED